MEDVLGLQLQTNQRLIIQVSTVDTTTADVTEPQGNAANVMDLVKRFYHGVSENEVEEVHALIRTRANLTRPRQQSFVAQDLRSQDRPRLL